MEHNNHPSNAAVKLSDFLSSFPAEESQEDAPKQPATERQTTSDSSPEQESPKVTVILPAEQKQGKKPKSKKIYLFMLLLLILGTSGSAFSLTGYQTYNTKYHQYYALAQKAVQHLQTAKSLLAAYQKNLLDAHAINQAHQEFVVARDEFVMLDTYLESLPRIITYIPGYGAKLRAGLDLLPIANEASKAGIIACDALNLLISRFHEPLITHQPNEGSPAKPGGLTTADLTTIDADFEQIQSIAYLVADQIKHIPPSDLQVDARLGKLFTTVRNVLPSLLTGLLDAKNILSIAPALLGIGTPSNYLIEVLDSTELRPGGGFVGNIGILTLSNARLASAEVTDVDLLDRPFEAAGHTIPYPPAYTWFDLAPSSWSLRDSNLDADFPTAARYAEINYKREGGSAAVQGVIAITPALIENVLAITGPIYVPEYRETVTAQNLISRIHYHQLVASEGIDNVVSSDKLSSQRKHFTALLALHLMARINQVASTRLPSFIQLFLTSLHSKDIQIYLNSAIAENLLQRFHLDAAIRAPPLGDSLFIVDANISPNKANNYIINKLDDQVAIDMEGNALHHTTISYAWTIDGPSYGASLYRDYVRVYVPPGSILREQAGWQPMGTNKAFGRTVWAGLFTLKSGQTQTITLYWITPHAAVKNTFAWQYQYLIQRQAGSQWTAHVQITLPSCANITNKSGGLLSHNAYTAMLSSQLNEDMNEGIAYVCRNS